LRNDGDDVQRLPDVILNFPWNLEVLGSVAMVAVMKPKRKPYKSASNSIGTSKTAGTDAERDVIVPRVHVYTFARADPETDRSAEEVANRSRRL
jgi:hypothetical protein